MIKKRPRTNPERNKIQSAYEFARCANTRALKKPCRSGNSHRARHTNTQTIKS